jgi:uncharacterized protein
MHIDLWAYSIVLAVGFFAGLVDSIAGGGGLITLPALLALGLPPQLALGTNKLQSTFGSFTATWHHRNEKIIHLREAIPGIIFTFIGAAIGTLLVQQIDNSSLQAIIPFLLVAIGVYFLFSPRVGDKDTHSRMTVNMYYLLFGTAFGFYDGFFGPGVGSFWVIAFVMLLGYNLTKATGYTKLMNFVSNITAFFFFLLNGNVLFGVGLVMAAGEVLGARLGTGIVISKGAKFIRPIYLIIVLLTIIKLFYQYYSTH